MKPQNIELHLEFSDMSSSYKLPRIKIKKEYVNAEHLPYDHFLGVALSACACFCNTAWETDYSKNEKWKNETNTTLLINYKIKIKQTKKLTNNSVPLRKKEKGWSLRTNKNTDIYAPEVIPKELA